MVWQSSPCRLPFCHGVELAATLCSESLTLETTVVASSEGPVPVSFGFHPYFGFAEPSRANWHLELPAMQRLLLDTRGIPTDEEERFAGFNDKLGDNSFDDGFALTEEGTTFSVAGANYKIRLELLAGYRYAQVFAPKDKDFIALEPMTAPASALTSGRRLRFALPDERRRSESASTGRNHNSFSPLFRQPRKHSRTVTQEIEGRSSPLGAILFLEGAWPG